MQPLWILSRGSDNDAGFSWADLCGSPWIAHLLQRKGFSCENEVLSFLNPRLAGLRDPFLLEGMGEIVERVFRAIDRRERVVLFGDYDVDGVTSLALLSSVLRAYGCEAALFLPHRIEEGYGLSAEGIVA